MFSGVRFRLPATMLLVLGTCILTSAQEPKLEQLLKRSPLPANAICYLHTPSLKSLLADANIQFEIADKVEEVWLVSELETESLRPTWEAGYATAKADIQAETLATSLGGYVDLVGDQKVVWTPRQSYVIPMSEGRVGFLRPARRNLLAQWVSGNANSAVPTFLAAQAKQPEKFLSLLLAVNLQNTFSPIDLSNRVSSFESLKGLDSKAMAELFSSVQGVSIIVGRKSLSECVLSVEFGQSPASLVPVANAVLNEILNRNGTSAPEVESWKVKTDGNKLAFQGTLSADSLDGILGIFSLRGYAEDVIDRVASKPSASSDSQMVAASKEYFSKVNAFIERVRKYDAQTTGYRAKWNEQQARRIDELGTLDVDPLLVDYGSNVSNILRGNATSIRSGNVSAGQIQAGQASVGYNEGYGYNGGYYGGYGYSNADVVRNQSVVGAQQRMAGFGSYREAIAEIDKMTGDIRRAMTEKHHVQF
jgi:hypothetical protein